MRRSYRRAKYLGIIERVRDAIPDAAITTDIIVGFPGETDEDHEATLDVVRQARFSGAFTFQYSKRPGTPAAVLEEQVPKVVVQERYERLVKLVDDIAWDENKKLVGRTVELLVAEGEGRKDEATRRLSGRAPDNRLVHFSVPAATPGSGSGTRTGTDAGTDAGTHASTGTGSGAGTAETPRPGDLATVEITYAAPHHLVADGPLRAVRRTRAGDAWAARRADETADETRGVPLGMPTVGPPQPVPSAADCAGRS
jgi:tRNA-2-methylthio-N6-dimethylallyladenosine synthase